jgi:hypothetical protein
MIKKFDKNEEDGGVELLKRAEPLAAFQPKNLK